MALVISAGQAQDLTSSLWLVTQESRSITFRLDLFFTSQVQAGQDFFLSGYFQGRWFNEPTLARSDFDGTLFSDGSLSLKVPDHAAGPSSFQLYRGTVTADWLRIINGTVGSEGTWTAVAVPEPPSAALLAIAGVVLGLLTKRRF